MTALAVFADALPAELAAFTELAAGIPAGGVRDVPRPGQDPERLILLGVGDRAVSTLRRAGAELARSGADPVRLEPPGDATADQVAAVVEGTVLGGYRYHPPARFTGLDLTAFGDDPAVVRARTMAAATLWARELTNTPASVKSPAWLAGQAQDELRQHGVDVSVRDETWLRDQRFGGVLAVGGGSNNAPRLIEARWRPRGAPADHAVLVGKGITFDTGGLNIKPRDGMRMMHTDMAGGAAVLGAVRAVAQLRLPVRVTALVPAAENSVSGSAYRPSDVVRHYGGRTTEVLNTDAEGRMVLADALAYAVRRLRPQVLVDVATLTGAMRVTFGSGMAGMQATQDELADELVAAGEAAGEPLWRLPLPSDYESLLDSSIADSNNAPANPGGIAAGLFLRPFTGGVDWAHLDIAGPARAAADTGVWTRGATGFGVALLTTWLERRAGASGRTAPTGAAAARG